MTLDADDLWDTYRKAAATPINDPPDRIAGLRAVEAAVRADERKGQIEKDAALVVNYSNASAVIRAQLTEGNGDE